MKRFIFLLSILLVLYLAGCGVLLHPWEEAVAPPVTVPETFVPETQAAALPTEPLPTEESQPATEPAELPPPDAEQPEPKDEDFVRVRDYIPGVRAELAYATENNFTGQKIYAFSEPWLRYGTVKKLMLVQAELAEQGLYIKIWDGFRPAAAQFALWEVYPVEAYVANPVNSYSSHSRGNTLDITMVYADGTEVEMPTAFDDFSKLADRDYSDCSREAADNARLLEQTMEKYGFRPYAKEWWHFSDTESYDVEEKFQPVEVAWYTVGGVDAVNLRTATENSEIITQIPAGGRFQILAWSGELAFVDYYGLQGYVLGCCAVPAEQEVSI